MTYFIFNARKIDGTLRLKKRSSTYIFMELLHLTVPVDQRPTADASLDFNMINLNLRTDQAYSVFLRFRAFLLDLRRRLNLLSLVNYELDLLIPSLYSRPIKIIFLP